MNVMLEPVGVIILKQSLPISAQTGTPLAVTNLSCHAWSRTRYRSSAAQCFLLQAGKARVSIIWRWLGTGEGVVKFGFFLKTGYLFPFILYVRHLVLPLPCPLPRHRYIASRAYIHTPTTSNPAYRSTCCRSYPATAHHSHSESANGYVAARN